VIDHLVIKGKSRPIQIFEVLGEEGYRLSRSEECFCKGLELYRRQEFKKASLLFEQGAEGDSPCRVYLSRCQHLLKHPPPPDWNSVWVSLEK
jgi:hypothetical protein